MKGRGEEEEEEEEEEEDEEVEEEDMVTEKGSPPRAEGDKSPPALDADVRRSSRSPSGGSRTNKRLWIALV